MRLWIKMVNGAEMEFFPTAHSFVIGRSPKCDIVIPSEGVSRQHVKIDVKNSEVYVTDLGSTNGVYIDGLKITPHQEVHYKTFLTLAFGSVQIMQIEPEEKTNVYGINHPALNGATSSVQPASTGNLTKTVRLEKSNQKIPQAAPAPSKNVARKKEQDLSQRRFRIIVLVVLAALFYITWIFLNNESNAPEEVVPQEEPKEIIL